MALGPITADPWSAAFAAFAPGINAAAATGGILSDHSTTSSGGLFELGNNWTVSTGGGTANASNGVPAQGLAALPALAGLPASVGGISTTLIIAGVVLLIMFKKKKG